LSAAKWTGEATGDPLMRTIADYMALLETSLTTAEAARYLKVDVSRIRQRLRERSLFGIDYDGERRLPRFQFERKRRRGSGTRCGSVARAVSIFTGREF
jgi:hypothetical protein